MLISNSKCTIFLIFCLFNVNILAENNNLLYIGGHVGATGKTKFESYNKNLGGKIGYSYYPRMSLELLINHQSNLKVKIFSPEITIINAENNKITLLDDSFDIDNSANNILLNLVYRLQPEEKKIISYFSLGLGVNQLVTKVQNISFKNHPEVNFLSLNSAKKHYYVNQFGFGTMCKLTDNFSVDFAVRLYLYSFENVIFEVRNHDSIQGKFSYLTSEDDSFHKFSTANYEISVGFNYQLPI